MVLKVSDSHGFWLDNNEEIKVNDLIPNQTEIYVINGDTIITIGVIKIPNKILPIIRVVLIFS